MPKNPFACVGMGCDVGCHWAPAGSSGCPWAPAHQLPSGCSSGTDVKTDTDKKAGGTDVKTDTDKKAEDGFVLAAAAPGEFMQ